MISFLKSEAYIASKVISSNAFVTICPGIAMTTVAWLMINVRDIPTAYMYYLFNFLFTIAKSFAYFFFYVYVFDLDNQIVGIEEDRLNKPSRPLVTGLLSVRGARIRHCVSVVAFVFLAHLWNATTYAVAWVVLLLINNHSNMSKHWLSKNLVFLCVGIMLLMAPGWQIVSDIPTPIGRWIAFIALLLAIPGHSQDMRDYEGDLKLGRKTLPIAFGMETARNMLVTLYCLVCPALLTYYIMYFHNFLFQTGGYLFYMWYLINLVWFCYVGWRLKYLTSKRDDHLSYMIYCGQFLFLCLSSPLMQ